MFWRQPMAHLTAERYDGNLYIWLEGGYQAFGFCNGFRLLLARRKVGDV